MAISVLLRQRLWSENPIVEYRSDDLAFWLLRWIKVRWLIPLVYLPEGPAARSADCALPTALLFSCFILMVFVHSTGSVTHYRVAALRPTV